MVVAGRVYYVDCYTMPQLLGQDEILQLLRALWVAEDAVLSQIGEEFWPKFSGASKFYVCHALVTLCQVDASHFSQQRNSVRTCRSGHLTVTSSLCDCRTPIFCQYVKR